MKACNLFVVFLILFLFLNSCCTIPGDNTSVDWLGILPRNCNFFIRLDNEKTNKTVKSILEKSGQSNPDIEAVLNYTKLSYLGIMLKGELPPAYSMVLLGCYPTFFMGIALANNREWKEIKNKYNYWQHILSPLQIYYPNDNIIMVSNGNIEQMLENFYKQRSIIMTQELSEAMEESDITLFFPLGLSEDMTPGIKINLKAVNIEEIWMTAETDQVQYAFTGVFVAATPRSARLFYTLFRTIMIAFLRNADVKGVGTHLSSINFKVEGNLIKMTDFFLKEDELVKIVAQIIKGEEEELLHEFVHLYGE